MHRLILYIYKILYVRIFTVQLLFIIELTNYVSVKLSMYNFVKVSLLYVKDKLI